MAFIVSGKLEVSKATEFKVKQVVVGVLSEGFDQKRHLFYKKTRQTCFARLRDDEDQPEPLGTFAAITACPRARPPSLGGTSAWVNTRKPACSSRTTVFSVR